MDGARPRPIDAIAVLVAAGLTLATGHTGAVLAILLAAAVPVLWLRRAPLAVAWVGAATAVALPVLAVLLPSVVPPPAPGAPIWPPAGPFAAYAAMAFAAGERPLARWLPVIVLALGVLALSDRLPLAGRTEAVIALSVMYGRYVRVRDRLRAELAERDQRVERERLAGELHDVVTHRVSRMVLQAGIMAMNTGDERARAAAEEIRAAGSEALDELRHMVALLRRGTGEGFDLGLPLPDLRPLVIDSAREGLPVELSVDGTPVPVPGLVGRTAYVVVEAALAHARKHAPGAGARVLVRWLPGAVRVTVRHTGGRPDAGVPHFTATSGIGLLDLRRQVELAGGTLECAPLPEGGHRIEATFPT
ncbi:histidine kinase [Nonomuraea sp. NPDC049421]|uniref:sensor histidine kinase n=1 Tax=Nonomuraea sp. NPDC049421 TaxID=3155275 RepID=UPI003447396F